MSPQKQFWMATIFAALAALWMGRYSISSTGNGSAYMLDRWLGSVALINHDTIYDVVPEDMKTYSGEAAPAAEPDSMLAAPAK